MTENKINRIEYMISLDRPTTTEDRYNRLGLEEFQKQLIENGWLDEEGIATKFFQIEYKGIGGGNKGYVKWTAILNEQN